MSKRIDPSWVVFASIENPEHDRCVDVFSRPDASFGFEEFRRDVEDAGSWTPVAYFSGRSYLSADEAYDAASTAVEWLSEVLAVNPALRRQRSIEELDGLPLLSRVSDARITAADVTRWRDDLQR